MHGQYLKSTFMLTKGDEKNVKAGETQIFGGKKGRTIRPYQEKHGDEYNEVRHPLPGFDEWLQSQDRACQVEVEHSRRQNQGNCSASQFPSLKQQGVGYQPCLETPETGAKRRSTRSTSGVRLLSREKIVLEVHIPL